MTDQLPAILESGALSSEADTSIYVVPALTAADGDGASWRYIDFFTANIRNPNTDPAYARACTQFLSWCEVRGLAIGSIQPFDVSSKESLQQTPTAPTVKQQRAAVRMLFDWLVVGQIMPTNPSAAENLKCRE